MFLLIVLPTEGLNKEKSPQLLGLVYSTQFLVRDLYYYSQKLLLTRSSSGECEILKVKLVPVMSRFRLK